jgi:hypothetical protein
MVYQNIATGDGFCNDGNQCVGQIDDNPPFSGSGAGGRWFKSSRPD